MGDQAGEGAEVNPDTSPDPVTHGEHQQPSRVANIAAVLTPGVLPGVFTAATRAVRPLFKIAEGTLGQLTGAAAARADTPASLLCVLLELNFTLDRVFQPQKLTRGFLTSFHMSQKY